MERRKTQRCTLNIDGQCVFNGYDFDNRAQSVSEISAKYDIIQEFENGFINDRQR